LCAFNLYQQPVKIDENEVHLDFHIYAILEFELLIGHPLNNLFQEKPFHRSLSEELGKITSAIHLDIPMAEHHSNHDQFEEVKFASPFVAHPCETERSSPPSLKPKLCPSGYQNVALDKGQDRFNVNPTQYIT
jgi:hypothetical protein